MFRFLLAISLMTAVPFSAAASETQERLITLTRHWLGTPYGIGPLGEGVDSRYDQDPLYRFDQFDCVTFVETSLSQALALDELDFQKRMNEIRYKDSEVSYITRNHFTEVDWIPNNLKNGILFNVMDQVQAQAQTPLPVAIANIDKLHWYEKKTLADIRVPDATQMEKQELLRELKLQGENMPLEVSELPYIPFSEFRDKSGVFSAQILSGLPEVLVLSVVRPGWDLVSVAGTELNISHQGLLLKINGEWVVRHATSDSRYRVVEDRLEDFLKNRGQTPGIKGIHLVGVNGF